MQNLMTTKEVAEKLKVSRQMVSKLVKEGKINAFRVGQRYRFTDEEIERYLRQKP